MMLEGGVDRDVRTDAACIAVVEHGPLKRALQWEADDAVFDMVEISVDLQAQPPMLIGEARIPLPGVFGFEESVARERIVEVVERGYAEHAFVEGAQRPVAETVGGQGIPRPAVQGFGFAPGVVTAVGVECRGVERQSSVTVEGGERVLAV